MLRRVTVENGVLEGIPAADPRITAFKGVPFAAPPVGENRWRAPQPAANWEGVRRCWKFAPISMQHIPGEDPDNLYSREWNVDPEIPMSEDCLYLNVWTPAREADEKLPVFVWYFGGGWQEGNTAEMEFDGERLARRGIVVVTVNYRLNAFGFLAHPEITAQQPDFPANFGFLDQRFGTMWVKRNIAAFGGDPDNITIGGQSAGGGSVMAQVVCPLNKGLFRRAIVDSGLELVPYKPGMIGAPASLAQHEQRGVAFFEQLGVKTLAEARQLDAEYIRDVMVTHGLFFSMCVDGVMCPGFSNEMLVAGEADYIPLLCGHTSTEFPASPRGKTRAEFEATVRAQFGDAADEFLGLVASKTGSLAEMRHKSELSHIGFTVRRFARDKAKRGDTAPLYYWEFGPEIPGWDQPGVGVFHSSDLWFWFENLAKCWRPFVGKHYDLARQMCNYWANFIRCGDPNGPDADGTPMPEWRPFTEAEPWRIVLGDRAVPEYSPNTPVMEFVLDHAK